MKRLLAIVVAATLALALGAQEKLFKENQLQVLGFAGAAAVINAAAPDFSFGGGLRWSAQVINPKTRLNFALEYADRGTFFEEKSIDLSGIVTVGDTAYFGLGFYTGLILDMEAIYGWDSPKPLDFGWVCDIGYRFPKIPGLTAGIDLHYGLIDLEPGQYSIAGGYINQLDIRWGGWLGYAIWRQP